MMTCNQTGWLFCLIIVQYHTFTGQLYIEGQHKGLWVLHTFHISKEITSDLSDLFVQSRQPLTKKKNAPSVSWTRCSSTCRGNLNLDLFFQKEVWFQPCASFLFPASSPPLPSFISLGINHHKGVADWASSCLDNRGLCSEMVVVVGT